MSYKNWIDCHSHSQYSPDSSAPVGELCRRAVELGYQAYAITDHCECDLFEADHYGKTVPQALEEVSAAKIEFAGKLRLLTGVEIGQPMQNLRAAEEIAALPFDMVLGSLHRAKGLPDYYFINYTSYDQAGIHRLLWDYYAELLEMAKWNRFDTLGHLTYPLRYMVGDFGLQVDVHHCDEVIDEIFRVLIQNGKAMEINTSGLRQKIGKTLPELDYVRRFRELGGELLTIGSDAHRVEDLGKGIQEGMQIAYDAGFRYVTYFENRRPQLLPIE